MPDHEPWMKPGVRDIRGLNDARPVPADRGVPHIPDPRIRQYVDLASRFIEKHRERIMRDMNAMNIRAAPDDIERAKCAIEDAKVVSFTEARKLDPTINRLVRGFYISGTIYLLEEYVDRWIRAKVDVQIWETLIHEGKHALLEAALSGMRITQIEEHSLFEWIYPYFVE